MPLIGNTRFECQPIPENLESEDEVYVCKATGEIFTDYEKFFDQTILCNSLIWTCEVTGHTGMTFSEALESERNSRRQLEMFPSPLHLPILHLTSLTRRTIFKDLLDDIFGFAKDRYFIGENVTVTTGTEKKNAVIIKVFPMSDGFNRPLGEDHLTVDRISKKSFNKRRRGSESVSFEYMSQEQNTGVAIMSNNKNMSRNRNLFNRECCKLFLKDHCEHKGKGIWRLKESTVTKYDLSNVKFTDYFAGPVPMFPGNDEEKVPDQQGQDRKDNNLKKKEEEATKEWMKARDDLLCDDLKDLPASSEVLLFDGHFGSAVTVMEFLSCFGSFCGIELPENFSISKLNKCLKEQECSSLFLDLLQNLLGAIFQMLLGIPEIHQAWRVASRDQSDPDLQFSLSIVQFFQSCEKKSKSKYQPIQDTPLRRLPLDSSSLTEVLRLHLLVGYYDASNQLENPLELQFENVTSEFSRSNPEIMRKLQVGNVLDLRPDEKLKLLNTLIDQILGSPTCREFIEDKYNKLKVYQKDLRSHIWAVQRRERDFLNYNFKKKQEEDVSTGGKEKDMSKFHDAMVTRGKKKSILDLKDKDFEEMPMEGIDWDQLTPEEKDHIKNWSDRRQSELQGMVESAQTDCCIIPIGMDRTYRRYWMFKSVPGLFVEDSKAQDFTIPLMCLQLVPQNKIFANNEGDVDHDSRENEENKKKSSSYVNVHEQLANRGKIEWSLYSTPVEFEDLLKSLNKRGHRENHLKKCFTRSKQKFLDSMIQCDRGLLTGRGEGKANESEEGADHILRSMNGELELARTIADLLLDLEERIFVGSLGHLKLTNINREEWRKGIETLIPVNYPNDSARENEIIGNILKDLSRSLTEVMEMVDVKYLGMPFGESEEMKQKKLKAAEMMQQHQQPLEVNSKVDDGEASNSQESFHNSSSNNNSNQTSISHPKTDVTKWKELVVRCSNFSQLYLFISLLDSSIMWSKSALNARCRICRKKKDGENMLLCDGCDQGHHMYCLKPPLKKIPGGDWFCPMCRPKSLIVISPRKASKNVRYKDYDSDFDYEEEESLSSSDLIDENLHTWKDDTLSKRSHHKRMCKESIKKTNGPNVTKINDAHVSNSAAKSLNNSSAGSETTSKDDSSVVASQPIKSRSGREIIRPKGNEQFIKEELSVAKKRDRSSYVDDDETYVPKKRKVVKNTRYSDDFDYHEDEGYDDDYRERDYSGGKKNQKKKRNIAKDEVQQRSKRSTTSAPKHSHRKTNAPMKAVEDLVSELMKDDNAWPFLKPVTLKQAPDYFDIIERPMDLSSIKYKIYRFEYEDQNQIIDDLKLMMDNCYLYNCQDTPIHDAGMALEAYLDRRLEEIERNSSSLNLQRKKTSV